MWSNRAFDERFVYLDTAEEIRLILEGGWNTLNGRDAVAYRALAQKHQFKLKLAARAIARPLGFARRKRDCAGRAVIS